jgi:hypothetical protein
MLKHLHPEHVEIEICRANELAQRRGLVAELDEMWSDVRKKAEPMVKHLHFPDWSVKQKLALTCQMLAAEGHESGLAGQISARAELPGNFWTLRFGLGFDEATADTLIGVDDDLVTLEGEGIPNPAIRFHLWIYRGVGKSAALPTSQGNAAEHTAGVGRTLRYPSVGDVRQ